MASHLFVVANVSISGKLAITMDKLFYHRFTLLYNRDIEELGVSLLCLGLLEMKFLTSIATFLYLLL